MYCTTNDDFFCFAGCTTPGKISSVLLTSSVFSSHNAALLTPAQLEDQGFIFGKYAYIKSQFFRMNFCLNLIKLDNMYL